MKLAIALAMPTSNERKMLSSNEALKELSKLKQTELTTCHVII